MSKEEFLKIQKCVLKVNIHCEGCKHKVKKILQKIDGVFTTEIDAEHGKVTVSGNVDPDVLIKKLAKSGKHAELWGAPKANNNNNNNNNNNQNQIANHLKSMQIENGKGGGNNSKAQKGGNNQPKGGPLPQGPNPQQLQPLQPQHQPQQMKGFQDLKNLPQFKGLQLPNPNQNPNPNPKAVKFNLPEDEADDGFTGDELDDYDDDDFDDELDDEIDVPQIPLNKMKPPLMGNGAQMMPNGMSMMNGNNPQLMNAHKGGGNGGGNGKSGGGNGPVPVQVQGMAGGSGGTKGGAGGGGGGNNQNQGGGSKNNGGKNGNNGGANKNVNNNGSGNGGKMGNPMVEGGVLAMNNDGFQNMGGGGGGGGGGHPRPAMAGGNVGPMGGAMPVPPMNNQMGNMPPAVQGLPAAARGGYFQGAGPDAMAGNPYHQQQQQQQYMAAMMNQQQPPPGAAGMGNDRYQPMMYARPPPNVNYMYPPPYPYPYPYPPPDPYTHYFSDENTSSCNVM